MANVAIITARGGSKRIPRKNIKLFRGKPMIAYSIETALNSGLFDLVMVSTDDDEIAELAKKHGAKVPFIRSKQTADDFTGTADVMVEVLNDLHESQVSQASPSGLKFSQLMVFAKIRAHVVLPTPLGPQNKKACAK